MIQIYNNYEAKKFVESRLSENTAPFAVVSNWKWNFYRELTHRDYPEVMPVNEEDIVKSIKYVVDGQEEPIDIFQMRSIGAFWGKYFEYDSALRVIISTSDLDALFDSMPESILFELHALFNPLEELEMYLVDNAKMFDWVIILHADGHHKNMLIHGENPTNCTGAVIA